jgi:hypothetical protein
LVWRKGAAKRRQTCVGWKGYIISMLDPDIRGAIRALTTPWI